MHIEKFKMSNPAIDHNLKISIKILSNQSINQNLPMLIKSSKLYDNLMQTVPNNTKNYHKNIFNSNQKKISILYS